MLGITHPPFAAVLPPQISRTMAQGNLIGTILLILLTLFNGARGVLALFLFVFLVDGLRAFLSHHSHVT